MGGECRKMVVEETKGKSTNEGFKEKVRKGCCAIAKVE